MKKSEKQILKATARACYSDKGENCEAIHKRMKREGSKLKKGFEKSCDQIEDKELRSKCEEIKEFYAKNRESLIGEEADEEKIQEFLGMVIE